MAEQLIHEAVARQAALRPDAVAVVCRGERLTYREVDSLADAWSVELAALGAGPGTLVPVHLPRSPAQIVALLAVLKCGAAYAALDRRWPEPRLADVLGQLAPPVVVTDDAAAVGFAGIPVWLVPALRSAPAPEPPPAPESRSALQGSAEPSAPHPPHPPHVGLPASAAACVFFTSGTTGAPKGVVSPHAATTRLFADHGPLALGPGRVMAQAAPSPWDAFSLELWGMLTTGGTVVVIEDDYLLPDTLREVVTESGVNTLWLTSSLFNLFVEVDLDAFAGLQQLVIGGERLSPSRVGQFLERFPETALWNGYGPVESCVFATMHPVRPEDCAVPNGIPIGTPVPGTAVHLLDDGDECPVGVVGELCVSGDGLALAYLGNDELTARCFPDVELADGPRRVYRTGDLAHRDADGVLHYVGRADRQVKVRGYRIEPAEIESTALRLAQVAGCAAVPVPGQLGAFDRIALFCTVPQAAVPVTVRETERLIRAELERLLPLHAVPDVVRLVERIPVTANGKADHHALLSELA
ncbi:amino acid adenylation domain-containing protein [Streptacidiphilus jiangxiensis]|uniref:Amino acid adenylation domain-containing protein n=1 Tax=Streptacidiphilus jiangxiensis TaxID=235985 RepID=A0A1H7Y465_STRJI|nr:amino acid adenylation domain-containing protein [Streptacidiphilus jiangxiensis]SEM40674.1 amino acid adenylation domain-containing protein [Streptacidiphilus jiangxiensis]